MKHNKQDRHIAYVQRGSALVTLKSATGHDPELLFTLTFVLFPHNLFVYWPCHIMSCVGQFVIS
jgi:hypothetical protein